MLAQKHLTAKKLADENNQHETLSEQIALAVQSGRDDLAQAGIAQQLDIEARVPVLENSLADLGSQERELDTFVVALLAKQREMQAALHDWQRSQAAAIGVALNGTSADKIAQIARAASKSGDSFNRVMQRQGGVPVVEQANAAALQDLADLSRKAQIEARLAALKSGK